jgi:HSP20 family molecular chaperone IbpA
MNKHTCSLCALALMLGTTLCTHAHQTEAAEENAYHSPFKQMSEFFDEFDKVFSQQMKDLEKRVSEVHQKNQDLTKKAPQFTIKEEIAKDGSSIVIKATLPGFARDEIQVKFVTTEEQGAGTSKTLEITAEHQSKASPKAEKKEKGIKGSKQEVVVHIHHVYSSSSYENGKERKVMYEDGKVKIQYDLPNNVILDQLDTTKEADYINLDEKGTFSIRLPLKK